MRYEIEAGTDAAALLLFDPKAIPAKLDRRSLDDGGETLQRLDRAGLVCLIHPVSDGIYLLHIYADEPIPDQVKARANRHRQIKDFPIPSGRLCFAGLEYALREDNTLLRQHPHPGGSATLSPGTYTLTLLQTSYPEGQVQEAFRAQATGHEYLAWVSMKFLIPLAVAAWIGLVVIFFTNVRVPFPNFLAPLLGLIFVLPFVVRRFDSYAAAKARFVKLQRENPSIVAHLEAE
jgi:hypothetical protein